MFIFTILFYLSVGITILAIILAIKINPKYYWIGSLTSYFFSFLGSLSIGIYTLSITFALFALALAHKMKWIKNYLYSIVVIMISLIIWILSILIIDDAWLFYPFRLVL
ncbi:hypothetical protein [Desulfolucanica intricata]|uniref:hypothetical protein n=1 Tax=Desulfolucanica intricata TaxID=1285191 RepID=UPI00082FEC16|nr:hypothetical protein [Desulfolucanica intricata]